MLSGLSCRHDRYRRNLPKITPFGVGQTARLSDKHVNEAVELHLRGMREDGLPIPEPTGPADYVEAA